MHEIKEKSEVAKKELVEEMASRPVLVSRAPVWHKYGIMAFYPKLVKGDAIRISPLIVSGFGADFDGDAMNYHAIADDDAAKEAAERMLPSRNLIATDDLRSPMHMPSKQFLAGLFAGTEPGGRKSKQSPTVFRSKADLARAYEQGKISYDDPVIVADD
jgi:DNA-directed RNA polymerase subunit beta'